MPLRMECAPAFDYARAAHSTTFPLDTSIPGSPPHLKALFTSPAAGLALDLRFVAESTLESVAAPAVALAALDLRAVGHKGVGVCANLALHEGQVVTFVLRIPPERESPAAGTAPTPQKADQLGVAFEREWLRTRGGTVLNVERQSWCWGRPNCAHQKTHS